MWLGMKHTEGNEVIYVHEEVNEHSATHSRRKNFSVSLFSTRARARSPSSNTDGQKFDKRFKWKIASLISVMVATGQDEREASLLRMLYIDTNIT